MSPADVQRRTAAKATSAGIALLVAESPAQRSFEDAAAEQTADVAVVVVEGSCSWRVAESATDFADAGLEDPRRKARSWAAAASRRLFATCVFGHTAMNSEIGLVP